MSAAQTDVSARMHCMDGAMAEALQRGRTRYNARFGAARKGGALVDGDSFLVHLGNAVAPIVDAVHREAPQRVDLVLDALFDVSLELFASSMLGPRNKSPAVGEVWSTLLPAAAKLVALEPKLMAAALSNAGYNLGISSSERVNDWISLMRQIAPKCETAAELLGAGKVAAWRAGMPHYRNGAIQAACSLRPVITAEILEVPAESCSAVLDGMRADPWLTPMAAARHDPPAAIDLVSSVGAFRGFGGDFLRPPTVSTSSGAIFVSDGDSTWRLICDVFGQTLLRHEPLPPPDRIPDDIRVTSDGIVHWGPGRASLPQLSDIGSFACDGKTLAITLRTSHHVFLVARATRAAEGAGSCRLN